MLRARGQQDSGVSNYRIADIWGTILSGSPFDLGKLIVEETEKWSKVVKFASGVNPVRRCINAETRVHLGSRAAVTTTLASRPVHPG